MTYYLTISNNNNSKFILTDDDLSSWGETQEQSIITNSAEADKSKAPNSNCTNL